MWSIVLGNLRAQYRFIMFAVMVCCSVFIVGVQGSEVKNYQCQFAISQGQQALRELVLNDAVFNCLQQDNYQDLVVVNSLQQQVPLTIKPQRDELRITSHVLPFYQEPQQANFNDVSQINKILQATDADISELKIDINKQAYFSSVIVDLSAIQGTLVDFQLQVPSQQAYNAAVIIEVSDTLNSWRTINKQQYLQLINLQSTLNKSRFTLPNYRGEKYMRLSFISSQADFYHQVQAVTANVSERVKVANQQWKKVTTKERNQLTQRWQYRWQGRYPINKIRFSANSGIRVYGGAIYTKINTATDSSYTDKSVRLRDKLKAPFKKSRINSVENHKQWRYRSAFNQSWLEQSTPSSQNEKTIDLHGVKKIEMRFETPANIIPSQLPDLEIGWREVKLVFLAQGQGPYSLLAGNVENKIDQQALAANLLLLAPAQTVSLSAQNSAPKLVKVLADTSASKSSVSIYLLWLVLFIVFAVLILMVSRLSKNMSK